MRILALAIPLALSISSPAWALSCLDWEVQGALPASGAVEVPTNARIVVQVYSWDDSQSAPILRDADGNEVATTIDAHDAGSEVTFFLTPGEPLAPGPYTVEVERAWDGAPEVATSFVVGDAADVTPPLPPTIVDVRGDHDTDEWGDWDDLTVEMPQDSLDDNGVIYELTITDTTSDQTWLRYSLSPTASLSDNPCSDDDAALVLAHRANVDVRALDVAGNSSDEFLWVCGTGCSTTGGVPVGGLFALLPLVALRRRKNA